MLRVEITHLSLTLGLDLSIMIYSRNRSASELFFAKQKNMNKMQHHLSISQDASRKEDIFFMEELCKSLNRCLVACDDELTIVYCLADRFVNYVHVHVSMICLLKK